MDWYAVTALGLVGVNLVLAGANGWMTFQAWKRLERVQAADRLLTHLCADAFIRYHEPIWRAWADAGMGTINVDLRVERRAWDAT